MAQILLDVEGFQTLCDFKTGDPMEQPETALMAEVMKITPTIPYPGDRSRDSIGWTTEAALAVDKLLHPDYMFLSFAAPMMLRAHDPLTEEENREIDRLTFDAVERFFRETDFEPIVIGGGDVSPIIAELDFSALSKKPVYSPCASHLAGLFHAEAGDEEILRSMPHIRSIITKEEYIAANPGLSQEYIDMLPDYLIMRENEYTFAAVAKRGFPQYAVCDVEEELPVYTTLGQINHIRSIYALADKALSDGKRVAIVLLESIGKKRFRLPYQSVCCVEDFFPYDQGLSLYFTLNDGKKYSSETYPPVAQTEVHLSTGGQYPFSMFFSSLPTETLGCRPDKVTAAVGTRSGFVHACTMADLCVECHSRNLSDSGILVLVNDEK